MDSSINLRKTELDQINKGLSVSQTNVDIAMKEIEEKEQKLAADMFKAQNLQNKLAVLEKTMNNDTHELKMEVNRQNRELDANKIEMQQKEDDLKKMET